MWWKAILLYSTFITIIVLIVGLDYIATSVWFLPYIMLIITEFILCNKYITWREAQILLFIYD